MPDGNQYQELGRLIATSSRYSDLTDAEIVTTLNTKYGERVVKEKLVSKRSLQVSMGLDPTKVGAAILFVQAAAASEADPVQADLLSEAVKALDAGALDIANPVVRAQIDLLIAAAGPGDIADTLQDVKDLAASWQDDTALFGQPVVLADIAVAADCYQSSLNRDAATTAKHDEASAIEIAANGHLEQLAAGTASGVWSGA